MPLSSITASSRRLLASAAVSLCLAAPAWSAPPTDESIETLLAVTQSEKLIEKTGADMEKYILSGVQAGLNGRQPTEREQQFIDRVTRESAAVMREEFNWNTMRPLMVQIYKSTFTQEEVDGQIAFYRTPVGAAAIAKMPAVMDATMQGMQQHLGRLMPKLQAVAQKAKAELSAEEPKK